jgi:hypothetical protein
VTAVTSALGPCAYVLFIEQRNTDGAFEMTKFFSLALAAALLLPGVMATLNQAALIVA